jgi:general secretion pathway protein D
MRRLLSLVAMLLIVLAASIPLAADSAHSNYNKGVDAEKRQDYERAFEYFQEAFRQKPKDLRYRTAYEHTKFLAAAAHVHRGQLLRDGGKLEEAIVEFQKASAIDPSSFIAQQELRRAQELLNQATNPPQAVAPQPNMLRKRLAEAQGPVELTAISNVPITLKSTEDTKVIYEIVGKLAGINVLFDPDYTSRKIRIDLNGVTLEEALGIIALESKTFWRPVTPNTIFVATDNPAKRKEVDQSVIKTFYLSNLSQATELQDVVNAMRTLLEVQRIQQLQSQNAIIVRGTPDQIALAQKFVDDLDKAKPEVIVDVVVMQVSRDKNRTLGITPPTSTSISLNNNINNTATGSGTSSGSSGSNGGINLNRIGNLNATDFTITIPGITASAIMGDSSTKILQNPQIRALDGQKATLKIGDRVPVATGSFQPGIGGVGINPLVNTQFQYLDVGVNIDITPRVHAGREVTLKVSLDISSVTGQSNIGGISQPIIGQRKIEHEIRLKEGEVNLLGGMMEEDQTQSISGWPVLASLPFVKYFFGSETKDHRENELVFALIPHVVRGPDVNDSNQRLIDVGTANSLQLRHTAKSELAPGGGAAAAGAPPAGGQAGQARPATPGSVTPAPTPTPATAPGAGASFLFDPGTITAAKGSTFTVNILISGAQNVYSVPLQLNYDPSKLQLMNVSNGGFLSQDGQTVALVHREDETSGTLQITATRPPNSGGVSGQGSVVTLTFMAKAGGQSPLTITRGGARDPAMQAITVNGAQAVVTIQ